MIGRDDVMDAIAKGQFVNISNDAAVVTTHISQIILTEDRAYKLKRPVRLPFLDYSTLEKRHEGCLAELQANSALAGNMYLGVKPVVALDDGRFRLGGSGEIVDWLVEMKRFAPGDQFDDLARNGRLTDKILLEAAGVIAQSHANASPNRYSGHATDYRAVIRELHKTETEAAEKLGLTPTESGLYEALDTELARLDHLIENRRRFGKVRRCHGDLHLRNMCLFEGKTTLFDAIEFDERLATTDVLYDLAYLLMDLLRLDMRRQANLIMNAYWDQAEEDEAALRLLPFFASLRAAVRMAVAVASENLEEADEYRKLAQKLLEPDRQINLAIGGLSGVGKSTIARELAWQMPGICGARWLRSDVIRKSDGASEVDYSEAGRAAVYQTLRARAQDAARTGTSVILDATFDSMGQQSRTVTIDGPVNRGIWLTAPLDTRLERIWGRLDDPSDADEAVAREQKEPYVLPEGWSVIGAAGPVEATMTRIKGLLGLD